MSQGDIGVSTVVGSAVFNIVGVTGIIGLIVWKEVSFRRGKRKRVAQHIVSRGRESPSSQFLVVNPFYRYTNSILNSSRTSHSREIIRVLK